MKIKTRLARTASSGEDVLYKTQARCCRDCWINTNKFKKLTFKKHQRPVKAIRSRKTFFRKERTIALRTYNHQLFFSLILTNPDCKLRTELGSNVGCAWKKRNQWSFVHSWHDRLKIWGAAMWLVSPGDICWVWGCVREAGRLGLDQQNEVTYIPHI